MNALKRAACLAVASVVVSSAAQAVYLWESVTLPASSGASCGNGTPYRFFVNKALATKDLVVVFEGGGACWDQTACEGKGKLVATNPNGIPTNYMASATAAVGGLVTPFSSRLNPLQTVRTQRWNQVYMPYCTGDVHAGSKIRTYNDANPSAPRVQYHQGQANVRAAANWLRANLGRPNQLLITGFSAGGTGATAGYAALRDALAPRGNASLIADSGPLFNAPQGGTAEQYPSLALHNRIRSTWGLDEPGGLLTTYASWSGFDKTNLGTVTTALAGRYRNDRIAVALFGADEVFSAFSYAKLDPQVGNATGAARLALLNQRWQKDIDQWLPSLNTRSNIAWYLPWYRNVLNSHCLSVVDWSGTAIEERRLSSFGALVDNTLDRGTPLRARETDQVSDLSRPVSLVATVVNAVASLFGQ
jgi:Pectinacetylesterase